MLALIDRLTDYPAIAPMVYLQREDYPEYTFYDTWAFRKDGRQFSQAYRYCRGFDSMHPFMVDSAGSVLVMRGELARSVHFTEDQVIAGLCGHIYEHGGSVWLDPQQSVFHA